MYQRLIIVGFVGQIPEMKFTPDAKPVTSFSVATSRKFKGEDETTWFRVTVWGPQAEACNQYLAKGAKVLVEGRLVADPATGGPRVWQKKDGAWAASFEVLADRVQFLSSKQEMQE